MRLKKFLMVFMGKINSYKHLIYRYFMVQEKQDKGLSKLMIILKKEKKTAQHVHGSEMVLKDYLVKGLDSNRMMMHTTYHNKVTKLQVFGDYVVEYNDKTQKWKEVKGD